MSETFPSAPMCHRSWNNRPLRRVPGVNVLLLERDNGPTSASYAAAGIIVSTCMRRYRRVFRRHLRAC